MEIQEVKEQLKSIFRQVINNDKWITIHPHGEDSDDYRRIKLEDGETPKEAIDRTYGKKDNISKDYKENTSHYGKKEHQEEIISLYEGLKNPNKSEARKKEDRELLEHHLKELNKYSDTSDIYLSDEETKRENKIKEIKKELNKKQSDKEDKQPDSKDDEPINVTEDYYNRISKEELQKEFKDIQKEFAKWKDKKNFPEYKGYRNKLLKIKDIYEKRFGKQSDTTDQKKDKVAETKILEGGVKEFTDEHGRIIYSKKNSNKKVKIHKNGNFYLASYGQELKDDDGYTEFQVFPSASGKSFKTEEGARRWALKQLNVNNDKEQDMALLNELKKLISKVENSKENDMEIDEKIENEAVDKRKLIDEVAGIMKSAGCDDEVIRTAIGKMEKIGYDKSEAGSADNKKVKNEDEKDKKEVKDLKDDMKKDVDNKCKNSKDESTFDKINAIYNSIKLVKEESKYTSRQEKLDAAKEYFS